MIKKIDDVERGMRRNEAMALGLFSLSALAIIAFAPSEDEPLIPTAVASYDCDERKVANTTSVTFACNFNN